MALQHQARGSLAHTEPSLDNSAMPTIRVLQVLAHGRRMALQHPIVRIWAHTEPSMGDSAMPASACSRSSRMYAAGPCRTRRGVHWHTRNHRWLTVHASKAGACSRRHVLRCGSWLGQVVEGETPRQVGTAPAASALRGAQTAIGAPWMRRCCQPAGSLAARGWGPAPGRAGSRVSRPRGWGGRPRAARCSSGTRPPRRSAPVGAPAPAPGPGAPRWAAGRWTAACAATRLLTA